MVYRIVFSWLETDQSVRLMDYGTFEVHFFTVDRHNIKKIIVTTKRISSYTIVGYLQERYFVQLSWSFTGKCSSDWKLTRECPLDHAVYNVLLIDHGPPEDYCFTIDRYNIKTIIWISSRKLSHLNVLNVYWIMSGNWSSCPSNHSVYIVLLTDYSHLRSLS